jgi:hypothetical protein
MSSPPCIAGSVAPTSLRSMVQRDRGQPLIAVFGFACFGVLLAQTTARSDLVPAVPNGHKAQSLLLIKQDTTQLGVEKAKSSNLDTFRRTQIVILRTRRVLSKALQDPSLGNLNELKGQDDPVGWLQTHLEVEPTDSPEVIRIAFVAKTKDDAIKLVKAITAAYMSESRAIYQADLLKTTDRLRALREDYDVKLRTFRQQYRSLARRADMDDPKKANYKFRLALDELAAAKVDLAAARSARYKLEAEVTLQSPKNDQRGVATTPDLTEAKRRLAVQKNLEERLTAVVKSLTDETKDINESTIDLRDLETEINRFEKYQDRVSKDLELLRIELEAQPRVVVSDDAG